MLAAAASGEEGGGEPGAAASRQAEAAAVALAARGAELGLLRGYGSARAVPKRNYTLEELRLNRIEPEKLLSPKVGGWGKSREKGEEEEGEEEEGEEEGKEEGREEEGRRRGFREAPAVGWGGPGACGYWLGGMTRCRSGGAPGHGEGAWVGASGLSRWRPRVHRYEAVLPGPMVPEGASHPSATMTRLFASSPQPHQMPMNTTNPTTHTPQDTQLNAVRDAARLAAGAGLVAAAVGLQWDAGQVLAAAFGGVAALTVDQVGGAVQGWLCWLVGWRAGGLAGWMNDLRGRPTGGGHGCWG